MMLQALIALADREGLGDPDFEETAIHWLLPLNGDGSLSGPPVQLLANSDAKKPTPKTYKRPFTSPNELSQGGRSHFLADNLERVLLFNPKEPDKAQSRRNSQLYFKNLLTEAAQSCPQISSNCHAVVVFLESEKNLQEARKAFEDSKAKPTDNVTFQVAGLNLLQEAELQNFWRKRRAKALSETTRSQRVCLATGFLSEILDTTEKIRGIPGGLAMGTNLISFDKDSFTSYGLEQAQNAAISASAELKFRSALQHLMPTGIRSLGESIHLHWTRAPVPVDVFSLLESADEQGVARLLESPRSGFTPSGTNPNAYYAMSLSGNGARIVVRDWLESTVPEIEAHVAAWFRDLGISSPDGSGTQSAFKLGRLLYAMVREKIDELPPQLPTQLLYSALRGLPITQSALAAALRRQQIERRKNSNDSDPKLNPARMALIKACLLRSTTNNPSNAMTPTLNPQNSDPAYLCGRLFAVLDRLQYLALGQLNAGISERFYASASTTPSLVMGRLFRNAQFHLAKAGGGAAENIRKDFEEISTSLGTTFPPSLDLEGQGRFALGYYHQKAEYRRRTNERKEQQDKQSPE
jgi:CRISPR-associated protein Csd1